MLVDTGALEIPEGMVFVYHVWQMSLSWARRWPTFWLWGWEERLDREREKEEGRREGVGIRGETNGEYGCGGYVG